MCQLQPAREQQTCPALWSPSVFTQRAWCRSACAACMLCSACMACTRARATAERSRAGTSGPAPNPPAPSLAAVSSSDASPSEKPCALPAARTLCSAPCGRGASGGAVGAAEACQAARYARRSPRLPASATARCHAALSCARHTRSESTCEISFGADARASAGSSSIATHCWTVSGLGATRGADVHAPCIVPGWPPEAR